MSSEFHLVLITTRSRLLISSVIVLAVKHPSAHENRAPCWSFPFVSLILFRLALARSVIFFLAYVVLFFFDNTSFFSFHSSHITLHLSVCWRLLGKYRKTSPQPWDRYVRIHFLSIYSRKLLSSDTVYFALQNARWHGELAIQIKGCFVVFHRTLSRNISNTRKIVSSDFQAKSGSKDEAHPCFFFFFKMFGHQMEHSFECLI